MKDRKKRILEEIDSIFEKRQELIQELVDRKISGKEATQIVEEQIKEILLGKIWDYLIGEE